MSNSAEAEPRTGPTRRRRFVCAAAGTLQTRPPGRLTATVATRVTGRWDGGSSRTRSGSRHPTRRAEAHRRGRRCRSPWRPRRRAAPWLCAHARLAPTSRPGPMSWALPQRSWMSSAHFLAGCVSARRSDGAWVMQRAAAGCAERHTRSGLRAIYRVAQRSEFGATAGSGGAGPLCDSGYPAPMRRAASAGGSACATAATSTRSAYTSLRSAMSWADAERFQGVGVGLPMEPCGHRAARGWEHQRAHERHEAASAGDRDQRYQYLHAHVARCLLVPLKIGWRAVQDPDAAGVRDLILREIYSACFARWSAVWRAGHRCPARRIRVRQDSAVLAGCLGGVTVPGLQPPATLLLSQTGRSPRSPRPPRSCRCLARRARSRWRSLPARRTPRADR